MSNRLILLFVLFAYLVGQEYSYYFDDAYVEIPSNASIQPTSGITIEAWVRPSAPPNSDDGILQYGNFGGAGNERGFGIIYDGSEWRFVVKSLDFDIGNLTNHPGAVIPQNTWSHIAGTYNGDGASIYLNGNLVEMTTDELNGTIDWSNLNEDLFIGKSNLSTFQGNIDEVRLWSIALEPTTLQANMNNTLAGNEANLMGYWNFNEDTTNTTIEDETSNDNDGTLEEDGGYWDTDVFASCEDIIITEFPYYSGSNPGDQGTTIGQGDDWNFTNYGHGNDFAYKLTLSTNRTLYIDTCDPLTNFDTILAIKSSCYEENSIDEVDDGPEGWCTEVDPDILTPSYPSIVESITLDAGTYYFIVDGYDGDEGNYGLAIGTVPEIIGSSIAADDSYIEILFSDPIYTESNGTGATNLADFDIIFAQNGGNATNVQITNLTNQNGDPLAGGEDTIRFNINVSGVSSGVETVTITPVDNSSIFNSFGIGVSGSSSVTQQLNDYFPPVASFVPADGETIWPSDNLVIDFGEEIKLAGNTDATNENIDALLNFIYTDVQQVIDFDATINASKDIITVNPENDLTEESEVQLSIGTNSFYDDFGNVLEPASATFLVSDATLPEISAASIASNNAYVSIIFSEGIYTNEGGNGGLNTSDFDITFNQNSGNATDASISSLTNNSYSVPVGGENELKLILDIQGIPSGDETILISPLDNNSIFDAYGNALPATANTGILNVNDKLSPTASVEPEDGAINVLETSNIIFTYTEPLKLSNGSNATDTSIDTLITLNQNNSNGQTIAFDATINSDKDEITINPNINFSSWQQVYASIGTGLSDNAGNLVPSANTTFRIRDTTPPAVANAILEQNNRFVDFIISEPVFGNTDGTGAVETDDLSIILNQNDGNATTITISSLSNTTDNQLSGGEDTLRMHLSMTGAASGVETIEINPINNSIFDIGGNALAITETSGALTLYDLLVPSVDTVSIQNRQTIDLNTASNIIFTFSEPLTSIEYSVAARHYPALTFSAETTTTELSLTLNPPLKALDTLDIDILEIVDNANLSTVDIFYEFYTPALADYDWNDTINVQDLTDFIKGWKAKNYADELGPVSGKIPHYLPDFDSQFDLDDGMVFTQMWGWAQDHFGFGGVLQQTIGAQPDWLSSSITVPMGTISGQVYIQYDPAAGKVEIIPPDYGDKGISLKHHDEQTGKYVVEFGSFAESLEEKSMCILPDIDDPTSITVAHVFYSADGNVISSGTQKLDVLTPSEFKLYPNYPNPFNPVTTIRYAINEPGLVTIAIYDIKGRLVATLIQSEMEAGFDDIKWHAENVSSGIYFCRLTAGQNILNSKLLLVK